MDAVTLTQYYELLEAHDWHYEYGDHRTWSKGTDQRRVIEQHALDSGAHSQLYYAYKSYIDQKGEKPARPGSRA